MPQKREKKPHKSRCRHKKSPKKRRGKKKSFYIKTLKNSVDRKKKEKIFKKYFGGMEKGCIFALAFDKERRFKERDAKRKRENIERMEQYEIACVTKKFSDARHLGAVTQKSQRL